MSERRHFIINPENLNGDRFVLNGQEGHHAARVTRMNSDDEITLLDGSGAAYEAVIDKKYLGKKVLDIFDREPVPLNPWDPMGSLARK